MGRRRRRFVLQDASTVQQIDVHVPTPLSVPLQTQRTLMLEDNACPTIPNIAKLDEVVDTKASVLFISENADNHVHDLTSSSYGTIMLQKNVVKMNPCIVDQSVVSDADAVFDGGGHNGSPSVDETFHADKCHHSRKLIAFKSCFPDAVMSLAALRSCQPVYRDLSVIRRDIVASGFAGTRRATNHVLCIQQILLKHQVSVLVLHDSDGRLNVNMIGSRMTNCLGLLHWDHEVKHVSILPVNSFTACPLPVHDAPWHNQCAGGKRAKAEEICTKHVLIKFSSRECSHGSKTTGS